jgi:O-6-methylguanine DNA methyltransferase
MVEQNPNKYTIIDTSIGTISAVSSESGLCRISIHKSHKSALESITQQYPQSMESPDVFGDLPQRLKRYAHGERIIFKDKLNSGKATPFQQAVWETTRAIPYGETRSYEWLAQRVGKPKAARAVGQALKSNPFPIIVPCHRVVGKDGSLTGFSCGIDAKKRLLDIESSSLKKSRQFRA